MSCRSLNEKLSEFLDGELSAEERLRLKAHLDSCPACRQVHEELLLLKTAIAAPAHFPAAMERQIWGRLTRRRTWRSSAAHLIADFRTYIRDFDRRLALSRLAAVPLTLACFTLLALQFPVIPYQQWTYSAFSPAPAVPSIPVDRRLPVMIHAVQRSAETHELMEKIWRIPYEDSLSFVAEIQPGGHAEIGSVLEYPRNPDLLEAIDVSLRNSRFERASMTDQPFLIYSFQKVDVYEARTIDEVLSSGLGTE